MSYNNSPKQSSSSEGNASEQYVQMIEQLIDSDDDQTIMKKMVELQSTFPFLKKMGGNITNQQKLTIFLRDHTFKVKLTDKLRQSNILFFEPIIKVQLYTIRHQAPIIQQLSQQDIEKSFLKFGNLETLMFDKKVAYFRYDSYVPCYAAIKTLSGFQVNDTLRLSVSWVTQNDLNIINQYYASRCVSDLTTITKRMARYDIYLQINTDFQLSKKIIGPKGINMKKILNEALQKIKITQSSVQPRESLAKLRLRGKGSGFLEGWNHAESEQLLNLCVSSKISQVYIYLCEEIEKLLLKIGWDFKEYYFKNYKKHCEGIIYRKYQLKKNGYEMTKQLTLEEVNNTLDFIDGAATVRRKIKEKEIIKLIALRDKARKQGRFSEADQIRQHLTKEGIMLIDSKHASGKEMKTIWKYL